MKKITVAKVRRICDVRGCNNIGAYNLSRTRISGNSVIICRECMEDALRVINANFEPMKETETPKEKPKAAGKNTKKGDA